MSLFAIAAATVGFQVAPVQSVAPQLAGLAINGTRTIQSAKLFAVAPAPTGSRFIAGLQDNTVKVFDAVTGKAVLTFTEHPQPPMAVAWSPNGRLLASGDESARIFIYDAATGKRLAQTRRHQRGIQHLAFNNDGTRLLSTGKDDVVKMYDTRNGNELLNIAGDNDNFYMAKFTPDGKQIVVATLKGGGRIYDFKGGLVRSIGPGTFVTWDIELPTAMNRAYVAGRNGRILVIDYKANATAKTLSGHEDWVVDVELTPNGKFLASSSTDGTVRLWDTTKFTEVLVIPHQSMQGAPICFTADGKYLISSNVGDSMQINTLNPPQPKPAPAPVRRSR